MKKQVKIVKENLNLLAAAIRHEEGMAVTRLLTAEKLFEICQRAEQETVLQHLTKREMIGAEVSYRRAVNLPNSYGYQAFATYCTVVRKSSGWFLARVWRSPCNNKQAERFDLCITKAVEESLNRRIRAMYSLVK
jgi:hypothetical protein